MIRPTNIEKIYNMLQQQASGGEFRVSIRPLNYLLIPTQNLRTKGNLF